MTHAQRTQPSGSDISTHAVTHRARALNELTRMSTGGWAHANESHSCETARDHGTARSHRKTRASVPHKPSISARPGRQHIPSSPWTATGLGAICADHRHAELSTERGARPVVWPLQDGGARARVVAGAGCTQVPRGATRECGSACLIRSTCRPQPPQTTAQQRQVAQLAQEQQSLAE